MAVEWCVCFFLLDKAAQIARREGDGHWSRSPLCPFRRLCTLVPGIGRACAIMKNKNPPPMPPKQQAGRRRRRPVTQKSRAQRFVVLLQAATKYAIEQHQRLSAELEEEESRNYSSMIGRMLRYRKEVEDWIDADCPGPAPQPRQCGLKASRVKSMLRRLRQTHGLAGLWGEELAKWESRTDRVLRVLDDPDAAFRVKARPPAEVEPPSEEDNDNDDGAANR